MRPLIPPFSHSSAAFVAALVSLSPLFGEFIRIGTPKLGLSTPARALSPDGSVLVGADVVGGNTTATYWTEESGIVLLPHASSATQTSFANDISDDGSVIVGGGRNDDNGNEAVRWERQGDGSYTVTLLTPPANDAGDFVGPVSFFGNTSAATVNMTATAVSGDGAIIVGFGDSTEFSGPPIQAWMWTPADSFTALGYLSGGQIAGKSNPPRVFSRVEDIDQSGSTIAGYSWPGLNINGNVAVEAMTYDTTTGQMAGLGDLVTPVFGSRAYGISPDGSVVIGQARDGDPSNQVAFRYTASGGMQALGDLPGGSTTALALAASLNGTVVVGNASTARGMEAFVWTEGLGLAHLETVAGLTAADLGDGYLETAVAVSDDGRTIAGSYIIPDPDPTGGDNLRQAYILRLSSEQLMLGPQIDPSVLAADSRPTLTSPQSDGQFLIQFSRDPDAGATYLLQSTSDLGTTFEDLISYQPDGQGGFQRQIMKIGFISDASGSTPTNASELFSLGDDRLFLRISVEP